MTINGGSVTAIGDSGSAGIGGGDNGAGAFIADRQGLVEPVPHDRDGALGDLAVKSAALDGCQGRRVGGTEQDAEVGRVDR